MHFGVFYYKMSTAFICAENQLNRVKCKMLRVSSNYEALVDRFFSFNRNNRIITGLTMGGHYRVNGIVPKLLRCSVGVFHFPAFILCKDYILGLLSYCFDFETYCKHNNLN